MKSAWVMRAVVFAACPCFAQDFCSIPKLRASTDASAALDRITDAIGLDPGTIQLYRSSDDSVGQKGGAMSLACAVGDGVERWIVYDPDLIPDAARDFVLAHETAHLVSFGERLPGVWSKEQELQADYYGAEYLTRLGWTRDALLQALDALKLPPDSVKGYPTLDERRTRVTKGFQDESARAGRPGGAGVASNSPDVALRFVYTKAPALMVSNSSAVTADAIRWAVVLWNMDLPDRNDPLPIPTASVDWLKANQEAGPLNLFGSATVAPLIKDGDRLLGSATVDCPSCANGRTYIVYLVFGQGGWFSEVTRPMANSAGAPFLPGRLIVPPNFSRESRENYFRSLETSVPQTSRVRIGER